jgi:hypothetical protein
MRGCAILVAIFVVASIILFLADIKNAQTNITEQLSNLQVPKEDVFIYECTEDDLVEKEIIYQAFNAGVNIQRALDIAQCESQYSPVARNPESTAKGVYQFLNSTWNDNCTGDVFNYKDNIACFIRWYPIYPSWWSECL